MPDPHPFGKRFPRSVDLTLTAHELRGVRYRVVAQISGDQSWTATAPFEVTIRPADLLD